jgi:hypothetical protein
MADLESKKNAPKDAFDSLIDQLDNLDL